MCADNFGHDSLEDMLREIAEEVGRSVERAVDRVNVEEIAEVVGVEPFRAREWLETAAGWVRVRAEAFAEEAGSRGGRGGAVTPDEDPLRQATPHPLDLPSEEQGLALAALDSGRWSVEPGSNSLSSVGESSGPSDALGLFRELRARDWITADGTVTLAGRHALSRWLDAAAGAG